MCKASLLLVLVRSGAHAAQPPGQARGGVGAEGLWCCELTPPRSSLCPSTKAGPLVGEETTGLGT